MHCWMIYEDTDYNANQDFVSLVTEEGLKRGFYVSVVLSSQLHAGIHGHPYTFLHKNPDLVISRQRNHFISRRFEKMGIPVFNNANVCEICNDKRRTYQFLYGLPMLKSDYMLSSDALTPPDKSAYPLVVKPACGHGGDRVSLVRDEGQWRIAIEKILPQPAIQQQIASHSGCDLRVYVVFGKIVGSVMRKAQDGFMCNYKRGGRVSLHNLSTREYSLANDVINRFLAADAPLSFAGIDFLYHQGGPVVSEVEDVVGSRMLYQVSDINIAALFWDGILHTLEREPITQN